jgi:hypothetical protein
MLYFVVAHTKPSFALDTAGGVLREVHPPVESVKTAARRRRKAARGARVMYRYTAMAQQTLLTCSVAASLVITTERERERRGGRE